METYWVNIYLFLFTYKLYMSIIPLIIDRTLLLIQVKLINEIK